MQINPLVTDSRYLACMKKKSIFKKEEIIEKISYERRAYESILLSHSWIISQKSTENKTQALMG